jgi:hypothetical protein
VSPPPPRVPANSGPVEMLPIPLKRPVKTDVKRPLMNYLYKQREKSMTLGDRLQKFNIFAPAQIESDRASMNAAFASLHDLRKEVTEVSEGVAVPTVVHYRTVLKYYAQLNYIQSRFPIAPDEIKIDFDWCDAFATDIHVKLPVLLWEKVSVMWNLASLQNNVGASMDVSREEGAKAAASHCSMAAGIFSYIQQLSNNLKQERTRDISPQLLTLMHEVCLANAQSCVYNGARAKGMAPASLARIALATSQAYQRCWEYARVTHARDDWRRVLEININWFHAAAQFWHSKADHENAVKTRKDWGIECGRLAYAEGLVHRVRACVRTPARVFVSASASIVGHDSGGQYAWSSDAAVRAGIGATDGFFALSRCCRLASVWLPRPPARPLASISSWQSSAASRGPWRWRSCDLKSPPCVRAPWLPLAVPPVRLHDSGRLKQSRPPSPLRPRADPHCVLCVSCRC